MDQGDYAKPYKTYTEFEYISPIQPYENENKTWQANQQIQIEPPEKIRKRESSTNKGKNKKQVNQTMAWLEENYTISEGICLPRCILYSHYLNFCETEGLEPACAATFGKMIRHKFPKITTRRLGTRGHSKYHYYGIGIRESSPYYHSVYSSKGLTRFSSNSLAGNMKMDIVRNGHVRLDVNRLSEYPDISKINLAPAFGIDKYNIDELLVLHKTNCLNIVEALRKKDFAKIQPLVLSFWRSIPPACFILLTNEIIVDIICLGDSVLHKNLIDILIPVTNINVEESHLEEMRYIAKHWEEWESASIVGTPPEFMKKKLTLSRQFAQSVKRQSTFLHLAKNLNGILSDSSKVNSLISDISLVDLGSIGSQAFYATRESEGQDIELNAELLKDLKDLLEQYSSLDQYISWLDSIIERKVIKPSKQNGRSTKKRAQDFLLKWSFFGARIMHNLSLNSAISFGSFHVLRMLFDEYILFCVETQFNNEKDQELATTVEKHLKRQARVSMQHYTDLAPSALKWKYPSTEAPFSTSLSANFQGRPTVINQGFPTSINFQSPSFSNTQSGSLSHFYGLPGSSHQNAGFPTHALSPDIFRQTNPGSYSHLNQVTNCVTTSVIASPSTSKSLLNSYVSDGDQIYTSLDTYQPPEMFPNWNVSDEILPQSQQNTERGDFEGICETFDAQQPSGTMHQCVPVISSLRNEGQHKTLTDSKYRICSTVASLEQNLSETQKSVDSNFQDSLLQFRNDDLESTGSYSSEISLLDCCQKYEENVSCTKAQNKPYQDSDKSIISSSSFLRLNYENSSTAPNNTSPIPEDLIACQSISTADESTINNSVGCHQNY